MKVAKKEIDFHTDKNGEWYMFLPDESYPFIISLKELFYALKGKTPKSFELVGKKNGIVAIRKKQSPKVSNLPKEYHFDYSELYSQIKTCEQIL